MFNARQLLGLELSAQRITRIADVRVRNSLATNLSDLLRYQKAKAYCDSPFEIRHQGGKKEIVPINGEWIGDDPNGKHRAESMKLTIAD